MRKPIRNLHSTKQTPPRFCDVVVEGGKVRLEAKNIIDKVDIPWEDVVFQVEAAKELASKSE